MLIKEIRIITPSDIAEIIKELNIVCYGEPDTLNNYYSIVQNNPDANDILELAIKLHNAVLYPIDLLTLCNLIAKHIKIYYTDSPDLPF